MAPAAAYVVWTVFGVTALGTIAARRRAAADWQPVALTTVAAASVVAFGFVSWGRATPLGDFNKAYYPAGALILSDPSRLYDCAAGNLCFVNLPIVAALFAPLAALGRLPAQVVFSIVGAVAVASAAWLLIRELDAEGSQRYAIVALVALNGPLLYSARLGNLTHVMLPFLAAAFAALLRGRDRRALIGGLAVIKPPLLLFLPYLVLRHRWRAAGAMAGTIIGTGLASLIAVGQEPHRVWLTQLVGPFSNRPVAAYNVQSIAGMLAHFRSPDDLTSWVPLDVSGAFMAVDYGLIALVLAAAATTFFVSGPPPTPAMQWVELSIVLVLVLLVSPLTWTHYYAFCVIPLAGYATGAIVASGAAGRFAVGAAAALVSAPVVLWLPRLPILGSLVARVGVSHYVFGGAAAARCTVRVPRRAARVGSGRRFLIAARLARRSRGAVDVTRVAIQGYAWDGVILLNKRSETGIGSVRGSGDLYVAMVDGPFCCPQTLGPARLQRQGQARGSNRKVCCVGVRLAYAPETATRFVHPDRPRTCYDSRPFQLTTCSFTSGEGAFRW